ncbi:MAG: 16S rRNA (guanine(527)-N(7))-methyltransferase RsmG [Firmicutes bacterium]|nr:16S rRNA (guanine(527)-N(7))-methyltransferase RsmG [Bacillota bacterium]
MSGIKANFISLLHEIGIDLSSDQLLQLEKFIKLLLSANQVINLTAITKFDEAMVKHIYDSLVVMNTPEFRSAQTVIDVGSGGGIPCIPLAICNPDKTIISIEATQKKINFQIEASRQLELNNLTMIWGRAEEIARQPKHREQYDLVIARALAPLDILLELTLPFLKLQGNAIYYKGKEVEDEIDKGNQAIQVLGAELSETKSFTLPFGLGWRVLLIFKKSSLTPLLYPRKPGIPQKRPL